MFRILRTSLLLPLLLLVAGCPSVQLINANQEFVSLMEQSAEAQRLFDDRQLDQLAFDSAIEGLQVAFAANGDAAVRAARSAETDQSKASLFNVAVRSYLKSGPVGDANILTIAGEGIDACSELSDLNALPTTCGYFHIAVPQAVSNEWQRRVTAVQRRAPSVAEDSLLTAEDGRELVDAAAQFFAQLDALEAAESRIDFDNAGENLRVVYARQQDVFFCNARRALNLLDLVVETDENWDRDASIAEARAPEAGHLAELEQRRGGFPIDTCDRT